ncbi:LysE family translocator [Tibeticola sp.]|jgi:threonine/homoserine/homoserine lactone efflux protein|uniref:LysE family translocator n=1 Tax=Tibeticola sp. TaxID=2005368 RepID=UPI00258A97BD|nr:LysE family translocator [Tibeticola sp.]MCI4440250.1 LysE family translocator [Tibeticola sp.]
MLTLDQLLPFLAAAVVLTLTPGPDNLMVLSLGASRGRVQGVAFGLGCAAGCLSHTLLAALGVSAALAASPLAFTLLRLLGGGYLVWLGIGALRSAGSTALPAVGSEALSSPGRAFARGVLANAINPKVALFFLSFLPQFVVPGHGQVALQMTALGLVFTLQAALIFGALGWFAGSIGRWLQRRPRAGRWLDRIAGMVFIALGLRLALAR